jgi:hypothetical protein
MRPTRPGRCVLAAPSTAHPSLHPTPALICRRNQRRFGCHQAKMRPTMTASPRVLAAPSTALLSSHPTPALICLRNQRRFDCHQAKMRQTQTQECVLAAPSTARLSLHPTPALIRRRNQRRFGCHQAKMRPTRPSRCVLVVPSTARLSLHPTPGLIRRREPETIRLPSGENATDLAAEVCPCSSLNCSPVFASHTRTDLSEEPETIRLPSGENAAHETPSVVRIVIKGIVIVPLGSEINGMKHKPVSPVSPDCRILIPHRKCRNV